MPKEYIAREDAAVLLECFDQKDPLGHTPSQIVAALPASDVVEVRHGRWIKDDETGLPICSRCFSGKPTKSVCSSVIEHRLADREIRWCYYCGAKMDGGQDDV